MKVILDSEQHPQGVFLPLADWEQLKLSIKSSSDLYKLMDELSQKDVFEMSPVEFAAHLAPVTEQAVKDALDKGLYFSYPAGPDAPAGTFIHEYRDGKKVLVEIDTATGKEHFLKNL